MKLILVRHGETREGKHGILLGSLPGVLTAQGKDFAKKVGDTIKKFPEQAEMIVSSDLKRATDTARIISKKIKAPIKFDQLLRERRGGIVEGKKETEIDWKSYEKVSLPFRKHEGGESFMEVKKRAIAFLNKIKKEKYSTVIIVSHNVFLSMLLSVILKWNYAKALKFEFNSGAVSVVDTNSFHFCSISPSVFP